MHTRSSCLHLQVAPTHLRGTLGSVNQLVICFGILGALVCNIVLPATQWRTIFALTAIPPVLLFLGELVVQYLLTASTEVCVIFQPHVLCTTGDLVM